MKHMVIAINDAVAYIAFFCVGIAGIGLMVAGKFGAGFITLAAGWMICCVVFGFWFVLSDIADSARKIADKQ